jgi:hypothetical protein
MKWSRFANRQIALALPQTGQGPPVAEVTPSGGVYRALSGAEPPMTQACFRLKLRHQCTGM